MSKSSVGVFFGTALALVLAVPACSPLTSDAPPMADSTFTKLLMEMHLLTARARRAPAPPVGVRDSLFAQYGVTKEEFEEVLHYYSRRPDEFESLYGTVVDSLRARQHQRPKPSFRGGRNRGNSSEEAK